MIGDATGYKFDPANITVKQGDAIKFVMVSGGPHNVAFQNVTDAAAKAQLDANMPGQKLGELSGPFVMQPNEAYTISFAKVPAGKYDYICTPHAAMNMKGTFTVQYFVARRESRTHEVDVLTRIHLVSYPARKREMRSELMVQVVQLRVAPMLAVRRALPAGHREAIIPT